MQVDPKLASRVVDIAVIGCGGTGAHVLQELPRFHLAKKAAGHPGLQVTAYDPARVSKYNVVRQRYFPSEEGMHKCEVLIRNRINPAYASLGLRWLYRPHKWSGDRNCDIIISCVDTKEARKTISKKLFPEQYVIDCGNGPDHGQVLIGGNNLGNPYEENPSLTEGQDDNSPSCSFEQSVTKQGLVTNMAAATYALSYLEDILFKGRIESKGCFFTLETKKTRSL